MLRLTHLIGFASGLGSKYAVDVAETAAATDAPLGHLKISATITESASPSDADSAVVHPATSVLESAGIADAVAAILKITATVAETVAASDAQTAPAPPITWDAGTVTAVTLSNGNLTASNTGTTSANQGAHGPSGHSKATSGTDKVYFEVSLDTLGTGANDGIGIGTTASTYSNMGNNGTTGVIFYPRFGSHIYANGSDSGKSLGSAATGDIYGVACDFVNNKFWIKKVSGTPGSWNGDGAADPATNTNGVSIPAGTHVPFLTFGGGSGAANNVFTGNFGGNAFTGAVPSGFTSGWY